MEDLYPPTQLQLAEFVRLGPHYLVGHKEEGCEGPTLRDLRPLSCRVSSHSKLNIANARY
jgi:hypothetical protein